LHTYILWGQACSFAWQARNNSELSRL